MFTSIHKETPKGLKEINTVITCWGGDGNWGECDIFTVYFYISFDS